MFCLTLQDLYSFCSFVLLLQLAIFLLYASRAAQHPSSIASVAKHVIDTLIAAVPDAIPTVITFALFSCTAKLKQHGIQLHQTLTVKTAAAVELVAFDKTGTLTGSVVSA